MAEKLVTGQRGREVNSVLQYTDRVQSNGFAHHLDAMSGSPPIEPSASDKPVVVMHGGSVTISETAKTLGELLAATNRFFVTGGTVVRTTDRTIPEEAPLKKVEPVGLASDFETVARICRAGGVPTTCSRSQADEILKCEKFIAALPKLMLISECPVLQERGDELDVVVGYDKVSGIFARGDKPRAMGWKRAVKLLKGLLRDFRFQTPADRSRAIASFITPALVQGGFLPERAPVDVCQADSAQTGKGFRNQLTAAIYNQIPMSVNQKNKSNNVGGLEQAFDKALVNGYSFIEIDNVRGKFDSQKIESFCTQRLYMARPSFGADTVITPSRTTVMLTSNQAHLTPDFTARCSVVCLLKQSDGYTFRRRKVAGQDCNLLAWVQANQSKCLAAVFAVIREWHRRGKPRTDVSRHARRQWAQVLDWIVQNLFGESPLLDGHDDIVRQVANSTRVWARSLKQAAVDQGHLDKWLTATALFDMQKNCGQQEPDWPRSCKDVGKKMAELFGEKDWYCIDNLLIHRRRGTDSKQHRVVDYFFSMAKEPPPNYVEQHNNKTLPWEK